MNVVAALALAMTLFYLPSAHALGAAAPFTPPSRVASPEAASAQAAAGSAALPPPTPTPTAADMARAAGADTGLSGVHLGPQPRALIDGEWVALGDVVRGARLHSLRADHAQLRHPDGRLERLLLTPLVAWQRQPAPNALPSASSSAAPRTKRLVSESP
ncbi:MAG: hypothetical protein AD742_06375 [Methylibium sp. NZG]|nr:MAG: hypothetical protein AD742_06375 [Methylibium sp. NZG]